MSKFTVYIFLALVMYFGLMVAANAKGVSALMPTKAVMITKAEAYEKICREGSFGDFDQATSCAMIEAAAWGDSDEILNKPLTYGDTPQMIYEYLESVGIIFEVEVYE